MTAPSEQDQMDKLHYYVEHDPRLKNIISHPDGFWPYVADKNRLSGDLRGYAKEIVDEWIGERSQLYKGYVIWAAPVTTDVPTRWSVDVVIERHHAGEVKRARYDKAETRATKEEALRPHWSLGARSWTASTQTGRCRRLAPRI